MNGLVLLNLGLAALNTYLYHQQKSAMTLGFIILNLTAAALCWH